MNPLLNDLRCNNNQITSLNLATNAQLGILFCQYNQLATLNLGTTSGITFLHCHENQLTTLDVSLHTALTELQCNGNLLTHLDITQNPDLITLYAHDNSLICLVANNGQDLDLNIMNNPQLTCATYPPFAVANALYDPTVNFNVVCGGPINNDVDIDQTTVILSAQLNGATYQWLDCENYEPIPGAIYQNLSVDSTGYYAVELTFTDCFGTQVDTSSCVYVDCLSGIDNDVTQTGATLMADMSGASYQS